MSWWKIVTEVTFVLKVHMYMFIRMNLCRTANHVKGCKILGRCFEGKEHGIKVDQMRKTDESLSGRWHDSWMKVMDDLCPMKLKLKIPQYWNPWHRGQEFFMSSWCLTIVVMGSWLRGSLVVSFLLGRNLVIPKNDLRYIPCIRMRTFPYGIGPP